MKPVFLFMILFMPMIVRANTQEFRDSTKKLLVFNQSTGDSITFDSGTFLKIKTIENKKIKGKLDFINDSTISMDSSKISLKEIKKCSDFKSKNYKHGKHLLTTGGVLSGMGGVFFVVAATKSNDFLGGIEFILAGIAAEIVAIPFYAGGAYYQNENKKHKTNKGWQYIILN